MSDSNDWLREKLEKMDSKLDRTDQRLDGVHDILTEQAVTLAKQSIILEDHTRRSLANEEAVNVLKEELKPIQRERYMVKGAMKFVAIIVSSAGIIGGILKFLVKM